jgi:phosphoribosylformimino-5-aminoimidazole carboxamide ribotide isomerase
MILYPAIDILDGRVVRLRQGGFSNVTDYGDQPLGVAERFRKLGARWAHVVDLSGARDNDNRQTSLIDKICATGLNIQTGGGIRTEADLEQLFSLGCRRVIIGSLAVSDPDLVKTWLAKFGGDRICLAFDVRQVEEVYRLAISAWSKLSTRSLDEVVETYYNRGLKHALVTDIGRDGMLVGPNLELYTDLAERFAGVDWQVSGGVSSLADLEAAAQTGAAGVIAGRALYEQQFDVAEALACLRNG